MAVLRPHLHDEVPLMKVATDAGIAIRSVTCVDRLMTR